MSTENPSPRTSTIPPKHALFRKPKIGDRVQVTYSQSPGPSSVTREATVTAVYPPRAMPEVLTERSTARQRAAVVPAVNSLDPHQLVQDVREVDEGERDSYVALEDDVVATLLMLDPPARAEWLKANRPDAERVDVTIERDPAVQGSREVRLERVPHGARSLVHGPFWSWDAPDGTPVLQKRPPPLAAPK